MTMIGDVLMRRMERAARRTGDEQLRLAITLRTCERIVKFELTAVLADGLQGKAPPLLSTTTRPQPVEILIPLEAIAAIEFEEK